MTYRILLRNKPSDGYVATALALPDCTVEAPTREEAIERIHHAIEELLHEGEIIEIEVAHPQSEIGADYAETFGLFRADPTYPEFLHEVEAYRRLRNQVIDE
jgi:predicted RNase H-like HicB family nuclease